MSETAPGALAVVGVELRQQTEFAQLRAVAARKTHCFVMFENVRRTTGPTMQTVKLLKRVTLSMHRPERLHAPWSAGFVN